MQICHLSHLSDAWMLTMCFASSLPFFSNGVCFCVPTSTQCWQWWQRLSATSYTQSSGRWVNVRLDKQLNFEEAYPHKLVVAWTRIQLNFLIHYLYWVLAKITTDSFHCDINSGHRFFAFARNVEHYIIYSFTPTIGSWWHQWEIMAVGYCHSWLRLWSDTFLGQTHKVMTSLILVMFILVLPELT